MFQTKLGAGQLESKSFGIQQVFTSKKIHSAAGTATKKRLRCNDSSSSAFLGPWATFEDDEAIKKKLQSELQVTENAFKSSESVEELGLVSGGNLPSESAQFHLRRASDWQGRSWMTPGVKQHDSIGSWSLPKRCVFTWKGHNGGVQTVRLHPGSHHLILSGSLDSTIKIWDVEKDRDCLVTYTGHSQAVRDIQFAFGGSKFYSCSFDANVNYWDTETGKICTTFTNNKINYSIAVNPSDNNSIITANHDKKALQMDVRSGKIVQEYSGHMGCVSTASFCEDGKRFVTTSDDRKINVWSYGIPMLEKSVSDPRLPAIPAVALHPSGKFFVGQSMNNSLVTFQGFGEFRLQGGRRFQSHSNIGYAIQPGFSPDGKFLMSGSSDGALYFWNWKSQKMYRNIKAHEGVCMGSLWNPARSSSVISWGWDGRIKLWE